MEAVKGLKPSLADVIIKRFGLGGSQEHTLEEIGETLGVSREWVRQMEERALKELRKKIKMKDLIRLFGTIKK